MKLSLKAGTTSKLLDLFIQDSSSTVGAGLGSIAFNTSGLTAYYYREGAGSAVAITLATMTLGTWATGGFVVIDGTNMLGAYQLGIPDAALAAGAKSVMIYLKGVTNMAPLVLEIELTAVDNQSATAFITSVATVTNLTNAPTAGDLTATMKASVTTAATAATPTAAAVTGAVGSVTGNVGGSVGSVTAAVTVGTNSDKTGYALTSAYDYAKGTVAMTEAYAANGAAPTPVQALFALHQMLMQFAISSTSYTVKKLDNSTTAFVVTLNDATTPTSAVRT